MALSIFFSIIEYRVTIHEEIVEHIKLSGYVDRLKKYFHSLKNETV